jgi:hypothetical protein
MSTSNPDSKKITDVNEDHVCQWFKLSEFAWERLDRPDGKAGKNADWKFSKPGLDIICEVKTIFSGGQSILTKKQWSRNRLQEKLKLDKAIANLPKDEKLIGTKDYLDWVNGKTEYPKQPVTKEAEYNKFLQYIREILLSDPQLQELPFDITISIGMFVTYNLSLRQNLFQWLRTALLWANEHHNTETFPSNYSNFAFHIDQNTEVFAHILGPIFGTMLNVGFMKGGTPYNEEGISQTIEDAMSQIRTSRKNNDNLEKAKSVIAFWSVSSSLSFQELLISDVVNVQLGEAPKRYSLFDWAFSQYSNAEDELTAIALFDLMPLEGTNFGEIADPGQLSPRACLILNPFVPEAEIQLKNALNGKYCLFMRGIESDPLASKDQS